MGAVGTYKWRAMSLVETIVALVILVSVFSIVTLFIVRIDAGSVNSTRVRATSVLDNYMSRTVGEKNFTAEKVGDGPFYLERAVTPYSSAGFLMIECSIFDLDHVLIKRKHMLVSSQ